MKLRLRYESDRRAVVEDYEKYIVAQYRSGRSCADIGREFGYTKAGIAPQLKRLGVKLRGQGAQCGPRCLTQEQLQALKDEPAGQTAAALAKKYNVSESTVAYYRKRK